MFFVLQKVEYNVILLIVIIQVVAGMNQDRLCIAVAQHLEKVFGGWKPPFVISSA